MRRLWLDLCVQLLVLVVACKADEKPDPTSIKISSYDLDILPYLAFNDYVPPAGE